MSKQKNPKKQSLFDDNPTPPTQDPIEEVDGDTNKKVWEDTVDEISKINDPDPNKVPTYQTAFFKADRENALNTWLEEHNRTRKILVGLWTTTREYIPKEFEFRMPPTKFIKPIEKLRAAFMDSENVFRYNLLRNPRAVGNFNQEYEGKVDKFYKAVMTEIYGLTEEEYENANAEDILLAIKLYDHIRLNPYPKNQKESGITSTTRKTTKNI